MKYSLFTLISIALLQACAVKPGAFSPTSMPPAPPDYSKPEAWAALPDHSDNADRTPDPSLKDLQASAQADVFFLHPTTLTSRKSKVWNASLDDSKLNQKTDESAILHQASIFNGAGRVFAPRYRQAHFCTFFVADTASAKAAWDLAYADVKAAFEFYLKNYNQGRPIIIASHSQGAKHGIRLMQEFFDGKPLQTQLVAAYLVGWAVKEGDFKAIPPCQTPEQIECFCSWRTFQYGHLPQKFLFKNTKVWVTNPLTWTTENTPAAKSVNEGTVLRKFEKIHPQLCDAEVHEGILWTNKPRFPGSFFLRTKNYHIADFNFFYMNVRKNAQARAAAFLRR
ncbi:MAG: DUF3089 domain-containing protein [Bacteroidota bacterium]